MLAVNDKVVFRTNGRGVTRVWKGVIKHVVMARTLPASDAVRACVPHGNKTSNRDRYIVLLDETSTLMWANTKTTVAAGKKLPKHRPRLNQDKEQDIARVRKSNRPAEDKKRIIGRLKMTAAQKMIAAGEIPKPKRAGGKNKKTTWYSRVNGKIVSQRKVICPEGYFKTKPVNGDTDHDRNITVIDGNVVKLK